jgi:hypothetical protein
LYWESVRVKRVVMRRSLGSSMSDDVAGGYIYNDGIREEIYELVDWLSWDELIWIGNLMIENIKNMSDKSKTLLFQWIRNTNGK